MADRIPLCYTFGNHMHWVDMEWLWGYDVLSGSTDDMLAYCTKAGVKGNLNFDGIGFEKMAAESPEHLQKLREAVASGVIEVVGGSYGQPYGLFQGGESNVRQRIYGVRTCLRLLGVRPRTFWEEEFDFYPQLPQMLAGCGFTGASLYFQWTWHTPEIPMEDSPVIAWEGIDGTQIPTATRNRMNLHQWPEDFRILLDDLAANPPEAGGVPPLVLQWLELMPTQDWMCRSELMIPMLAELKKDPRFEVLATTLGGYLEKWKDQTLPVRRFVMDEVWHGMTLGKNGDNHPKMSAMLERLLLRSETAAAILGLFGRPYEPWDVYPTWELEECWRLLLAAQHHDNHECEGLCGHVAEAQFAFIQNLLETGSDAVERLLSRIGTPSVAFNHLGWAAQEEEALVPAMGYSVVRRVERERTWTLKDGVAEFSEGDFLVRIEVETGQILELRTAAGSVENVAPWFEFSLDGQPAKSSGLDRAWGAKAEFEGDALELMIGPKSFALLRFTPIPEEGSLHLWVSIDPVPDMDIDPGYDGSVRMVWPLGQEGTTVRTDGPYSVQTVGQGSSGRRKYPEGDWMTSPQWFESVSGGFTSQSFVDFTGANGSGLLLAHSGSQQWFRSDTGYANVLLAMDPWDGGKQTTRAVTDYTLTPHRGLTNAECVRRSSKFRGFGPDAYTHLKDDDRDSESDQSTESNPFPLDFSAVTVHHPGVLATAFYREQASFAGRGIENYGGKGIEHPYILRLVEANGEEADAEITLAGPIAAAYKTNLLGEIIEPIPVSRTDSSKLTSEPEKLATFGIEAASLKVHLNPYEIATLYLDIVPGRKQFRDLDAKREIWATVHRTE